MIGTLKSRHQRVRPRRARSGYGIASLTIVLFLASVLISQFGMRVLRETQEANALAAFNVTQDRLTRVRMAPGHAPALLPHMLTDSASMFGKISIVETGPTANPVFEISTPAYKGRTAQLYLERMRSWLSMAKISADPDKISDITLDRIPDPYPERLARDGSGRMATDITFDLGVHGEITNVGRAQTSFGSITQADIQNVVGLASSEMIVPTSSSATTSTHGIGNFSDMAISELTSGSMSASTMSVTGGMRTIAITTPSLVANGANGSLSVDNLQVSGRADITGNFAARTFPRNTKVQFGSMNIDGLFANEVRAVTVTQTCTGGQC